MLIANGCRFGAVTEIREASTEVLIKAYELVFGESMGEARMGALREEGTFRPMKKKGPQ